MPTTPALVPLVLDEQTSIHREVTGVSQEVSLTVWIDGMVSCRLDGSLLWTHTGASGPVAMNASRHWLRAELEGRPIRVTVNFCPPASFDEIDRRLQQFARESPRATPQSMLARFVPASVASAILQRIGVDASVQVAHLGRDERRSLAHALAEWPLPIVATRGYNFAEATAGGVALEEIDPGDDGVARLPGTVPGGRSPRRGRPHRRLQFPVGVVHGLRRRASARPARLTPTPFSELFDTAAV